MIGCIRIKPPDFEGKYQLVRVGLDRIIRAACMIGLDSIFIEVRTFNDDIIGILRELHTISIAIARMQMRSVILPNEEEKQ